MSNNWCFSGFITLIWKDLFYDLLESLGLCQKYIVVHQLAMQVDLRVLDALKILTFAD